MFSLFQEKKRNYTGELSLFGLHDFEKKLLLDHTRIIDYYRSRNYYVPVDHFLVRLINSVSVPLSYPLDQYYDVCQARALYVANAFKLTTSINYGAWHRGIFYKNCPEIILGYVGEEIPGELAKGWRDIAAVKVLEHPITNLGMLLPDGRIEIAERGLAVIAIDIPALMVQYRMFMELQYSNFKEKQTPIETTQQFVAKFVLPNMLKSQTDIALINRIAALYYGEPLSPKLANHPFSISDYSAVFDNVAKQIIKRFDRSKFPFEAYVNQFPAIFSDYALGMPDIATTRQAWWALFLTRKKVMELMIDLGGKEGKAANGRDISQLIVDVRRFRSSGEFNQPMPDAIDIEMQAFFRKVMAL